MMHFNKVDIINLQTCVQCRVMRTAAGYILCLQEQAQPQRVITNQYTCYPSQNVYISYSRSFVPASQCTSISASIFVTLEAKKLTLPQNEAQQNSVCFNRTICQSPFCTSVMRPYVTHKGAVHSISTLCVVYRAVK